MLCFERVQRLLRHVRKLRACARGLLERVKHKRLQRELNNISYLAKDGPNHRACTT